MPSDPPLSATAPPFIPESAGNGNLPSMNSKTNRNSRRSRPKSSQSQDNVNASAIDAPESSTENIPKPPKSSSRKPRKPVERVENPAQASIDEPLNNTGEDASSKVKTNKRSRKPQNQPPKTTPSDALQQASTEGNISPALVSDVKNERSDKQTQRSKRLENKEGKQSGKSNNNHKPHSKSSSSSSSHNQHQKSSSDGNVSSGILCTICSQEDSQYWSIGCCNHSICSTCSLRLRGKSKDKQCPICKLNLDVVIIFSNQECDVTTQTFQSFPMVTSQSKVLDLLECVHPDVQVDVEHQMLYYKCPQHYKDMDKKQSLHCPLVSCSLRCGSIGQLCQHVSNQHQGQTLCKLCLEHRPLFCSEQQIFTKKEYKDHLKSTLVVDQNAPNAGYAYTTGHPLCQFCQEHVFDKHALYLHMQKKHFTCHLCDASMMFRYYADLNSLRAHHQSDHYVCSLCHQQEDMRNADICYAFRNLPEFGSHMKDFHGVRDYAKYVLGGNHSHRRGGDNNRQHHNNNLQGLSQSFFDLDLGNANPAPVQQARQRSQQLAQGSASNPTNDILQMIPANMRIAGRVTGTGTFSNEDRDLLALQEAVDSALASRNSAGAGNGNKAFSYAGKLNSNAVRSNMEFPSLPPSQDQPSKTKAATTSGDESPHPMSLVGKITAKREDKEQAKKAAEEVEDKKIARHLQLASAFGVNQEQKEAMVTSEDLGISANNPAYRKHIISALSGLTISPGSAVFNILYPIELLQWAKRNRTELIKIERKIATFLESPKDSSLHLKPMPHNDRQAIHCLSKYYHCQSVEYDYEPKRYVSMIKTVDTQTPSVLLSNAVTYNPFVNATNNLYNSGKSHLTSRGPVIYFVLNEGLLLHWGRAFERNKQTSQSTGLTLLPFHSKHVIFGEVILQIRALCREYDMQLEDYVDSIAWAGSNAFALQCGLRYFDNGEVDSELGLYHAIELAKFFIHISSLVNNIATASLVQGDAECFKFYRVVTDFTMPDEKHVSSGEHQVDADGFVTVGGNRNQNKPLPGIDYDDEVTFSREKDIVHHDEPEAEDHWTTEEVESKPIVKPGIYQPPRPQQVAPSSLERQLSSKVGDDWEKVEAVDEWEQFLAERKAKLAPGTVEPYRPKINVPQPKAVVVSSETPDDWEKEDTVESSNNESKGSDDVSWRKGQTAARQAEEEIKKVELESEKVKSSKRDVYEKVPKVINRFSLLNDDESDADEDEENDS